jgi:hypothetical protein
MHLKEQLPMSRIMKLFVGAAVVTAAATSVLMAQASVTLHMRNGDAVPVTLVDLNGSGFVVRAGGEDRSIPKDQVAWVDFGGSVNVNADAVNNVSGNNHLVVMRNGDTLTAEWLDVGGTSPLRLAVRTSGGDRDIPSNEVARIYLARPAATGGIVSGGGATSGNTPERGGMQADGSIAVLAAQPWTDTGINVRAGEILRFDVTRAIRITANDESTADGNTSVTARAVLRSLPVRAMPVGGLIARVGNGQPFSIGTGLEQVRMPVNGRLWLGINDLSFNDNSGHFRVVVNR